MSTKIVLKTNYNDEYLDQMHPMMKLINDNFIPKSTHFHKYKKWCKEKGEKPLSRKEFDAYNREWFSINYPDTYWEGSEKVYGRRVPVWYHIPNDHADELWYDENSNIVEEEEDGIPIEMLNRCYENAVAR